MQRGRKTASTTKQAHVSSVDRRPQSQQQSRAQSANVARKQVNAGATRPVAASVDSRIRNNASSKPDTSTNAAKSTSPANSVNQKPQTQTSKTTDPLPPPPSQAQSPDPLQVAAQLYPWMYMTTTLEACFKSAEQTAEKDLDKREKELQDEESQIEDQRLRFEAERDITFYDELGTDAFAKEAPAIMQKFLNHGDVCSRTEAQALDLAMNGASEPDEDFPLQVYSDMLDSLEKLQDEATQIESSILHLTSSNEPNDNNHENDTDTERSETDTLNSESTKSFLDDNVMSNPKSQIVGMFASCLPILRARIANLSMAQELIDSAQENLSISLRMESLGIE